jgi:hypothetical protein
MESSSFSNHTREVFIGGLKGTELIVELQRARVQLNEFAVTLLSSKALEIAEVRRSLFTAEVSVGDLGLYRGADISGIYAMARKSGLLLCPLNVGPHLRLQYLDQPEGAVGYPTYSRRAPPGSITIASAWPDEDDDFPKGFYLRRIEGTLWLRGYRSDAEHIWDPNDRFVFCTE